MHNRTLSSYSTPSLYRYSAQLRYEKEVVLHFQTNDELYAKVKLASAISDQYPYARGEIKDATTGQIIYRCCQTAIC